jgi:hypothetical protein
MESTKESLEKKNIFAEKYDEIRRLDGTGKCRSWGLQSKINSCTFHKQTPLWTSQTKKLLRFCGSTYTVYLTTLMVCGVFTGTFCSSMWLGEI